jgi:lipopolysaccharide/colanic/teichoic acid biosynthesis glycosyltransferase
MYASTVKPFLDVLTAVIALLLLSPLLVVLTLLLTVANKGFPFFTQTRVGKNEVLFKVIKFRTMNNATDEDGTLLPDAERLTAVGKFVRKTSLDELPQLLNVLNGDMSFVGPRPLLVQYLPLYNDVQKQRHHVMGGITGWAQVNGRNAISWQQKFNFDVFYVQNQSFWLDVRILFLTVFKVAKSEGISAANAATMEPFKGNIE